MNPLQKLALPLQADGSFSSHYGASAKVALFEVDVAGRAVVSANELTPPEAEPCQWADWLAEQGVQAILVSGMGRGAQVRFSERGIQVILGAPSLPPSEIVQRWLAGEITRGENACTGHGPGEGHGHHRHGHGSHAGHHGCGCSE